MHSYKRHLGDYAKDTGALTQADHGAYTLLIDYYYSTEKALPTDPDDLYAIGKASSAAEKKAVDRVLVKFFTFEPDGYHQKRIDLEILSYRERAEINSENGRSPKDKRSGSESLTGSLPDSPDSASLAISHKPRTKKTTKADEPTPLPGWLPIEAWEAFVDMRTRGRDKFTEYAKRLAIQKLADMRASGQDPRAILDQSVFRGWSGLFPVKAELKLATSRDEFKSAV